MYNPYYIGHCDLLLNTPVVSGHIYNTISQILIKLGTYGTEYQHLRAMILYRSLWTAFTALLLLGYILESVHLILITHDTSMQNKLDYMYKYCLGHYDLFFYAVVILADIFKIAWVQNDYLHVQALFGSL